MKRLLYYAALCVALWVASAGCTKQGSTGPQGATGAAGAQGAVGPAGANGTVIYSGTTAPDASTGNAGDFYLDLTTDVLYGPKTASGWGAGFSMKGATGATGATGAAGSQIHSGTGVPAAALGATGDYYLDKNTYELYGPKTASGWGVPVLLQGPPGTANVMYTPWFTPPTYTKDTIFGSWGFYYDEAVPAISQAILDNGTVITFGKLDGYNPVIWPTNQVAQMPITITYMDGANPNLDTWSALATPGNIRIELISSLNAYGSISNAHQFRCVIIPGGVSIPASIGYEELLRYLRVPSN